MTSYRGVETVDCVGMQPPVEPDRGLCGNHKPNRFFGIERKRLYWALLWQGPLFLEKGDFYVNEHTNDILYQAASVWKELTEYCYTITYGYKNKLNTINLTFSPEDFPHLAGFQYLRDLSLPRYNPGKLVDKILDQKITYALISKGSQYETLVKPRLEALVRLKDIIEKDFNLFSYMPRMYPFTTMIKADYLISSHLDMISFIFIIQATPGGEAKCDYLCCSAFTQGDRNYETNQRTRTILKKERIHISTQTSEILYNRLQETTLEKSNICEE